MPRPEAKPVLNPRQPFTVLGWSMQKQRLVHGETGKALADAYGCSQSHISRVERGENKPSRELVRLYDERFEAEGLLLTLYDSIAYADEQARRRVGGHRPAWVQPLPGDASEYLSDTVPHGTVLKPGAWFDKTWRIRNSGSVPWQGRVLERQGPLTGPGLITSERYYPVPDTLPGKQAEITVRLKAPTYWATSIAYFKMAHGEGEPLCYPTSGQLGLDVLIRVAEQPALVPHYEDMG